MKLKEIIDALSLEVGAGESRLDTDVAGGYVTDLLSCAMAGAKPGDLWVTLQGHLNVVAVASLNELAAVVVTEGKPVSREALSKAEEEGVVILTTRMKSFDVCGRLWELGVR